MDSLWSANQRHLGHPPPCKKCHYQWFSCVVPQWWNELLKTFSHQIPSLSSRITWRPICSMNSTSLIPLFVPWMFLCDTSHPWMVLLGFCFARSFCVVLAPLLLTVLLGYSLEDQLSCTYAYVWLHVSTYACNVLFAILVYYFGLWGLLNMYNVYVLKRQRM